MLWDIFISYAHEDRAEIARPLANGLREHGFRVWIDEFELRLGDSLGKKIEEGLRESRFGVVILSQAFFSKNWTRNELGALMGREDGSTKVILPVWHGINQDSIRSFAPLLADRFAISTEAGINAVIDSILDAIGGTRQVANQQIRGRYAQDFDFPLEILDLARDAIRDISDESTWPDLEVKMDMAAKNVWIGTDTLTIAKIGYSLYVPILAFQHLSYALNRSLSTFATHSRLRYSLLEASYLGLTRDQAIANARPPIEYSPRIPGWREKRQLNASRYWWQGLSEEKINKAKKYFVQEAPVGFPDLITFDDFYSSYLGAYASCGRTQMDLGLLFNPIYGFHPKARPVYWRLLTFWDRIYALYQALCDESFGTCSELITSFLDQSSDSFSISSPRSEELFESKEDTWSAVNEYFNRFVVPNIDSCASMPLEEDKS